MVLFQAFPRAGMICRLALFASALACPSLATPLAGVTPAPEPSVVLTDTQLTSIKIEPVSEHAFPQDRQAVGNIDFNQDLLTQVFTQYPGRIIRGFRQGWRHCKKGSGAFYNRKY